MIKNKSNNCIN